MTKKKASKSLLHNKAKQPHRVPIKVKHTSNTTGVESFGKKPFASTTKQPAAVVKDDSAVTLSKNKRRKLRRSNSIGTNTNNIASLFGAVGKSSVKIKKVRHQQQQQQQLKSPPFHQSSSSPAAAVATTATPEKMNNKKKSKRMTLKNPSGPKLSRRQKREALQQQPPKKGGVRSNGMTRLLNQQHHQQLSERRLKGFRLPRPKESRKLSQSPWFSHSLIVPPPLPTTTASNTKDSSATTSMATATNTSSRQSSLPYPFLDESFDYDASCWDWLDYELRLFANYVRLQQVEIQARENLIAEIKNLALRLFRSKNGDQKNNNTQRRSSPGGSSRKNQEDGDDDEGEEGSSNSVRIEAFGSYAAQPVCCFQSDIDLALWGVVAAPKEAPRYLRTVRRAASATKAASDAAESASSANTDKKRRRENRIERWKQALDNLNDAKLQQQRLLDEDKKETDLNVLLPAPDDSPLPTVDKESSQEAPPENSKQVNIIQTTEKRSSQEANENDAQTENDDAQHLNTSPPIPKRRKPSAAGVGAEFLFVLDRTGVEELGGSPLPTTQGEPNDDTMSHEMALSCDLALNGNPGPADSEHGVDSGNISPQIPSLDESIKVDYLGQTHSLSQADGLEEGAVASKTKLQDDATSKGNMNSESVDLTVDEDRTIDLTMLEEDSLSETSESGDGDSPDKLSGFKSKSLESDDDSADKLSGFYRQTDGDDVVSLSSSTTSNTDDDEWDDSGLEVSFVSSTQSDTKSSDCGPKGQKKQQVVTALVRLGNALRKQSWTQRLEVRKHARVPIINMTTVTGVESDIALGGHTGVDTRLFATMLASRYASFSPVVLALKILLNQQGLDLPFTGGLGSYKLYVLVAYHLERHLAKGGSDKPGEVLVSFFFRYGVPNRVACIDLSSVPALESHGGTADILSVYKIAHCTELFRNCWCRLNAQLREWDMDDGDDHRPSFLTSLVRANDLERQRSESIQQASRWNTFADKKKAQASSSCNRVPVAAASSVPPSKQASEEGDDDESEAARLMHGYGLQLGADGNLVPVEM